MKCSAQANEQEAEGAQFCDRHYIGDDEHQLRRYLKGFDRAKDGHQSLYTLKVRLLAYLLRLVSLDPDVQSAVYRILRRNMAPNEGDMNSQSICSTFGKKTIDKKGHYK